MKSYLKAVSISTLILALLIASVEVQDNIPDFLISFRKCFVSQTHCGGFIGPLHGPPNEEFEGRFVLLNSSRPIINMPSNVPSNIHLESEDCSRKLGKYGCFDALIKEESLKSLDEDNNTSGFEKQPTIKIIKYRNDDLKIAFVTFPNVYSARFYLLKVEKYFPTTPFQSVHSDVRYYAQSVSYHSITMVASLFDGKEENEYDVYRCAHINMTLWPVFAVGIGQPAFYHYKPDPADCMYTEKFYPDNGGICRHIYFNLFEIEVHDLDPSCNTDVFTWRVRFKIVDTLAHRDLARYKYNTVVCSNQSFTSVHACETKHFFTSCSDLFGRFCKTKYRPRYPSVGSETSPLVQIPCLQSRNYSVVATNFNSNSNILEIKDLKYDKMYKLIFVTVYGLDGGVRYDNPSAIYNQKLRKDQGTQRNQYYVKAYQDQKECNEKRDVIRRNIQKSTTTRNTLLSESNSNQHLSEKPPHLLISIVCACVAAILTIVFAIFVLYSRRYSKKNKARLRLTASLSLSMELRETRYEDMIRCPSVDDKFEIDSDRVMIFKDQVLGQGAFGKVYKGKIKGLARTSFNSTSKLRKKQERAENMRVAVKQCHEFADAATKREFLYEIKAMKEIYYHRCLVNILHCITEDAHKPTSLILEYCELGDLLKFLQHSKAYLEELQTKHDNERIILFKDVAQIAFQVADGMAYLAEKGYIHRDLAARNIMVKKGKHVKIGDFGLCRSVVSQDDVYTTKGGRLPIKWMAIESIWDYQFSLKSDVWSYGVLLYEVTTLGLQPYADVVPQDGDFRRAMIAHLRSGARLEQPASCPDEIYAIMKRTWAEKPEDRASFAEIRETARRLVESLHDLDGGVYGDRYVGVEVNRCDQSDEQQWISTCV